MTSGDVTSRRQVAVVGGGIAGLAAAYAIGRAHPDVDVTVLEGADEVGGKLRLGAVAGVTVDVGAEAVLNRRPEAVDLARAVGLADDLVHPTAASARVWTRGSLRPLPAGQVMGVPTDLRALARTGVLSKGGLARVPLDHVLPGRPLEDDVAVGAYVASRVGGEVVDRLVEPLLGGVYAGHARELSLAATIPALFAQARTTRSLLDGADAVRAAAPASDRPVFAGVRGGVGRLPSAVAAASRAKVRTGATVRELHRTPDGFRLVLGPTADVEELRVDAVVLAVPAAPASRLLREVAPSAATDLASIEYASSALVTFAFPAGGVAGALEGSGFLVPPVDGRFVKASTFSSNKWSWTAEAGAAAGVVLVRASIGRHREEIDLQQDDAALAELALADLRTAAGWLGDPVDTLVTRWGGGLPQYAVGHLDRVARIRRSVDAVPGLAVAGAYLDGVGVAACVASASAAADRVGARLTGGGGWRS